MADGAAKELTKDHGRQVAGEELSEMTIVTQSTTVESFSQSTP